MTGSLAEIRLVLAEVSTQLNAAYQQVAVALSGIEDARSVLAELGQHSEPLVPAELNQAVRGLEDELDLIRRGVAVVAEIDARM
jgi:hypothetical protein